MPGIKSIATGYLRAYKRLKDAYSRAYDLHPDRVLDSHAAEEIWIELFECLNWLDALRLSTEGQARMDPDFAAALGFVRGRVHHAFADAIEFRDDVLIFLRPTVAGRPGAQGPLPVADWCWLGTVAVAGGKRTSNAKSRQRSGETAYERLLAGKQVSGALEQVAALATEIHAASLSTT